MRSKPKDLFSADESYPNAAGMETTNNKGMHSPKAHDYAFSESQQIAASASKNNSNNTRGGQSMIRDGSTSSIPDYFTSSSGSGDSPASLSRSSSTTSDHPWANLFPEGAAGAATNMPRREQTMSNALASSLSMSTTSSQSSSAAGPTFKMPASVGRMHSGNSFASTSTNGSVLNATDMARFLPIKPQELADILTASQGSDDSDSSVLIIDIRPSTSYSVARIRGSINLCAPSTLLKRSGVTVQRIEEELLANEQDQIRFSGWKSGPQKDGIEPAQVENGAFPIERIVVLDTDTMSAVEAGKPSAGGGGACLIGLLRKFDLAGFAGQLHWLVGGFNSFSNKVSLRTSSELSALVDYSSQKQQDDENSAPSGKGPMPMLKRMDSQRRSSMPSTRTNPVAPLSGLDSNNSSRQSLVQPRGLPMEAFSLNSTTRRGSSGSDRRGMQMSSSQPTMDVDGQSARGDAGGSACANPFFDNIRQNRELQHGITERIPLELPPLSQSKIDLLPSFLRNLVEMQVEDRTEALAKKFFDIEKAEQRRLIATMQQHASESNLSGSNAKPSLVRQASIPKDALQLSSTFSSVKLGQNCDSSSKETFPFSIAAALERGSENRYNNIWTYEHSRIRCAGPCDFLNGSYLEPARAFGCKRRYIATQAPLPSTFNTFWQVVWQQNVRTICMVTREFESGRVQSHNYWKEAEYGGLYLKVVEEVTMDAKGKMVANTSSQEQISGGNFFPSTQVVEGMSSASTIKRKFALSYNGETRYVVQLQYVAWPDFSIPDDAEEILDYIKLANKEQHNAEIELRKAESSSEVGPLLVHCSAGVGRTGTYVVIDSVLDVLRRGRRGTSQADVWDDSIAIGGSPKKAPSFSELTKMTPLGLPLSQPRKSLKRELSPSVMDIDSGDYGPMSSSPTPYNANGVARHGSSPPPLRRGRSDEINESDLLSLSSITTPFSPTSLNPSSSGSETPSGAMDNMKIAWDSPSPHTSIKSKLIKSAHTPGNDPPISSTNLRSTFAAMPINMVSMDESVDLIQQVVETIREQRMSTVQTGRQFVFAYRAVIEGVIRESSKTDQS